jgi:hypothetical protein
LSFDDAENNCRKNGSHLISYSNTSMQQTVETSLIDGGLLLPSFHKSYWIGLNTTAVDWKDVWRWTDNRPYIANKTYQNWGMYQPGTLQEPNNITAEEFCAAANSSQPVGPTWGWSDTGCFDSFISICYYARGLALLLLLPGAACSPPCMPLAGCAPLPRPQHGRCSPLSAHTTQAPCCTVLQPVPTSRTSRR